MAATKHTRTNKMPTTEPTISPVLLLASLVDDVLTKICKNYFYIFQDIDIKFHTNFLLLATKISLT